MSKINVIQNAIKELEGGSFQKLFDAYLYKKYKFTNIQTLGVQEGTNKTTKGTPDSFVVGEDEKYILIMYGTVETDTFSKMKKDILSCFNTDKLQIEEEQIAKIICACSSTNIHVEQMEELRNMIPGIEIDIIGLSTISHDLLVNYPFLASEYLNISVDTQQIFTREEFIKVYDKNGMNAPLGMEFCYRDKEKEELYSAINNSNITLVTGASGVGKTRLVLEVCKRFEDEGWDVLCVKNNGEVLYNDMKYYTSDEGKYILFIDDANQTTSLEYVLDYVTSLSNKSIIKLIMTVRDYAKTRVKTIICKYLLPIEITINILKDDEIKEILKTNLGIQNREYLERIVQISKGNARLAILAGKIAIENGYLAIRNATDIFANYYGRVINNSELKDDSINALFVVSLLGAIRFKESIIAQKILELVGINTECFVGLCHELNEKELVDLYQDEVVKISDQSLGNYIVEYVLIEEKTISISQLLEIGFPKFKNKLVFALNTLIKLFYSDELAKYIEEQVNKSWSLAEESYQDEYLKCFHALNEEKALGILKQRIDTMHEVDVDVSLLDIDGKKNYNEIKTEEVNILCGFKYSEYYEDAVQLMLIYYKKRPDLIMDFYFAFSDRMSFDMSSYSLDYEKEYKLVEYLWKYADNGKDINITRLLLHVLKEMLKCSFHKTEQGSNHRTFNMITFQIVFSEGSKKLRSFIWEILSDLYTNDIYSKLVGDIIAYGYVRGLDSEKAKKFYEYDLECIEKLFFEKWECLSFEQCKMLRELEKHSEWLEIEKGQLFARYNENTDFVIYNTLVKEHLRGRSWREDELERQKQIEELIKNYGVYDYVHLFEICKMCEEKNDREDWSLKSGLDIIFSLNESDSEMYYEVIKQYLLCGAPYGHECTRVICFLLKNFGIEKTKKLIEEKDFVYKQYWLKVFWEMLPEESLNVEYTNELLEFVKNQALVEKPNFPMAIYLSKYKVYNSSIIENVSQIVLDCCREKSFLAESFLGSFHDEAAYDKILDMFSGIEDLLEKLYLFAFGHHFDYDGKLLLELIKKDYYFWDRFTLKLSGNVQRTSYEHNIFENIWRMDEYSELINIAYNNMLKDHFSFMIESEAITIFANSETTPEDIRSRKKKWIEEYIQQNFENTQKIKMIFDIIATIFPAQRKEFLLALTNNTKDMELLKVIPLFPSSSSWSGSEVPLIDKKIEFLSELLIMFKGVEFVEYRFYLKEWKTSYEKYKQDVLIREYLENEDIA